MIAAPPTPTLDAVIREAVAYINWWSDQKAWHSFVLAGVFILLVVALLGGLIFVFSSSGSGKAA